MGIISSLSDNVKSSLGGLIPGQNSGDIVKNILNTDWDISDDFEVSINNYFMTNVPEVIQIDNEMLKKSIISVELPTLTSQELDYVFNGTRRTSTKMQEQFRFNIRFRDFEGGIMRKYFTTIWTAQNYAYFDEVKSVVKIEMHGTTMFYSENCIITQISSQTYDHSSTGIAEFEITFISPSFTDVYIKELGIDPTYAAEFATTDPNLEVDISDADLGMGEDEL